MASIVDLCWTSSEDLFEDLDLDALYTRQFRTVGGDACSEISLSGFGIYRQNHHRNQFGGWV